MVLEDAAKSARPPMRNPAFSALLLAGGKSTRMGRDKATVIVEGQPLWRRQLATLTATGAHEIFISGKSTGPYMHAGIEVLEDLHPDCGPLAGLEAALRRMQTPLLCVLAIDLPWMTAPYLSQLVEKAFHEKCGVVPQAGDRFEPLAAVYPRAMLPLVEEQLSALDYSMQPLIRRAVERNLVTPYAIADEDCPLFRNVNTPADLGVSF